MAPKFEHVPHAPLAATIEEPIFINDRAYVLEPSMKDWRRNA